MRFVGAGLSLESAAKVCGVDVRTFRRWEADNRAPLAVQKLLLFLSGELMHFDPQFKGFRLRDGKLFHDQAPYGLSLGDIRAVPWILAERDELRVMLKRLESQMKSMASADPVPNPSMCRDGAVAEPPASGLVSYSTNGTHPTNLFIHEAVNADITPSACIDKKPKTENLGHFPELSAPIVYTDKHKPRYGNVGVYRQHSKGNDETRTPDPAHRRGTEDPVSTTGRPAWNERLGYAPPVHARKRASLPATGATQGNPTTAQEAPAAPPEAQAPLGHSSTTAKGSSTAGKATNRSAAKVRNPNPSSATTPAESNTPAPAAPRRTDLQGMDAAQRAGCTDDPRALARNGEAAHRQAQEGIRSAGRSPEHDRGLSVDGQRTAHANPLDTFAAVGDQSQQNGAGIKQLYTLCAVMQ